MSTAIINTTSNTKIITTNNVNKIEVNSDNIIQSDSEFREVVKKGYLLNNINLSTIPDIIQEAIDAAILDAKEQTLSDALIDTLRTSLQNLDDGIYKKTYIDNTITYLENLLTSKVNLETVASIADNKLAIALQGFASTSSVSTLSSRVESSETEIINVKESINTKDTARATQISEMEARLNDTFAGYSEAVELYVDENGNVKSEKIETLTTNIGLQLQEVNQLIIDTDNEWNAKSVKLITSPSGAITGYSFQDGSGLKSNFNINADSFKISNSTNTYTPFSIIDNNITFNGKVSFSNTTTSTGQTLVNALDELQNQIDGNITTWFRDGIPTLLNEPSNAWNTDELKNQHLGDIYYDNATGYAYRFAHEDIDDSPDMGVIYSWVIIADSDVTKALLEISNLDGKVDNLELAQIASANNLTIAYKNYTDTVKQALIDGEITQAESNAIAEAQTLVDTATGILEESISTTDIKAASALVTANTAVSNASTAQASANTANALLTDIASDNKLTPNEKLNTKKEWDIIVSEKNKNVAQANTYEVSVVAYNSAYNTLNTYITSLLTDLTITSDIEGSTFRSMFKLYYDARTDLLNAIATKIKSDLTSTINNLTKVESISWQQEVQNAINNNATYVDAGKITTGLINANRINTNGLIAENISANEIVGKTFTGAVINGAVINGAVVKASYLDLDGELEVLTNYHITPAMYNANPSLYTDAVYLSGNNEYRIPSLSMVREPDYSVNINYSNAIFNSKIRSYNAANAGHNIKCVNVRPKVTCTTLELFKLDIVFYTRALQNRGAILGTSDSFDIYIAGTKFGTFYIYQGTSFFDNAQGLYKDGVKISPTTYQFNGFNVTVDGNTVSTDYTPSGNNYGGFSVTIESIASDAPLSYNFDNTQYGLFYIKNNGGGNLHMVGTPSDATLNTYATAKTSSNSLYINNMV